MIKPRECLNGVAFVLGCFERGRDERDLDILQAARKEAEFMFHKGQSRPPLLS